MKKYILTEEELIELLSASLELNFLESRGKVANYSYKDIAKQMLSEYEEVK